MKNAEQLKRPLILVAFAVCLFWTLQHISPIYGAFKVVLDSLSPLFLGVVIAFIVNIPMNFFESSLFAKLNIKKSLKRVLSVIVSYLVIVAVIFVVVFMVVPQLGRTVMKIATLLPQMAESLGKIAVSVKEAYPEMGTALESLSIDQQKFLTQLISYFQNAGTRLINSTVGIFSAAVSGITKVILGIVFSFYMLMNKEKLILGGKNIILALFSEKRAHDLLGFLSLCRKTLHSFVTGQCLEAVILGCMFTFSMSLLKFPYALLIGVLISFTALIPIVGAFIGCGVGVFLIFTEDPIKAVWFVLLFLVLQQVEGNLIYPKVVGNSVGLPSMWVLAAVTCGGSLMGVFGMLIFIPLFSVFYTCLGHFVKNRLEKKGLAKDMPE